MSWKMIEQQQENILREETQTHRDKYLFVEMTALKPYDKK